MSKFLLAFTFKSTRPIQKLETSFTCLRHYSTKSSKLKNIADSNTDDKLVKEFRKWSNQDTDKLFKLVDEHGRKWKSFTDYFPGRSAKSLLQRYDDMKNNSRYLTPEDKKLVQELLGKEKTFENIDWEHVQKSLHQKWPMYVIQKYYRDSMDPALKKGKWTEEETQQLMVLVSKHGKDWQLISEKIGAHSKDHCSSKYKYEMDTRNAKTGRFSKEEDEALIDAVNKYGTESFNKIKKEMNTQRTAQQLDHRYRNYLDPALDKSPWTQEEQERLISLCVEFKDIRLIKERFESKRGNVYLNNRIYRILKRIKNRTQV